jgi:hypothetical protein
MPLHRIQHKMHELPTPELPPLLIKPIDPDQLLGMVELQLSGQMPDLDSAGGSSGDGQAKSNSPVHDDGADTGGTYR